MSQTRQMVSTHIEHIVWLAKHFRWISALLLVFLSTGVNAMPDNWEVEGENGMLHVSGLLTEGACRLDMQSSIQEVSLGITSSVNLQQPGQRGTPVAFQLYLRDCLATGGDQTDWQTGSRTSDRLQPVVSVTFWGEGDTASPALLKVKGASGMGLRLLDDAHRDVRIGRRGAPLWLNPYNSELTYYVVPERTSEPLIAGAYQAVVDFRLNYD